MIPQLIQEKIQYYYDRHYRHKWTEGIKTLHTEYNNRIKITNLVYENILEFQIQSNPQTYHTICTLDSIYEQMYYTPKTNIKTFTIPNYHTSNLIKLPKYYQYSSGK